MFTLIRLFVGVAVLGYVAINVMDIKDRIANHEENPLRPSSVSSVASTAFGSIKDYVSLKQSESGFYGGNKNSYNSYKDNRGGFYNSNSGSGYTSGTGTGAGRSMKDTACEFYPDQCK